MQGGAWQPLDDPYDRHTSQNPQTPYQEFVYFHPFVQRFLYPSSGQKKSFRLFQRIDVSKVRIDLQMDNGAVSETLNVDRVHLYLFDTEIAILAVEISAGGEIARESVLAIEDQFRRVYPPFWKSLGTPDAPVYVGGQCPLGVQWLSAEGAPLGHASNYDQAFYFTAAVNPKGGEARRVPVAKHWAWLLGPLQPGLSAQPGPIGFEHVEDDRIPSMVYLQCREPEMISPGDLMRHCFYDGVGDAAHYPYNPKFLADFEKQFLYTRFWEPDRPGGHKTLYMSCGYGFTALMKNDGLSDTVLREHFRHHYFQLGLLAHFHRASLLRYSRRFNAALLNDPDSHPKEMRDLREQFGRFIATSWFHEVSNQEQGRELFELWNRQLGSERLMKNILAEVEAVDEVLGLKERKKIEERLDRMTILLYIVGAATLAVAFVDSEIVRKALGKEESELWKPGLALALTVGFGLSCVYSIVPRDEKRIRWHITTFALLLAAILAWLIVIVSLHGSENRPHPRRAVRARILNTKISGLRFPAGPVILHPLLLPEHPRPRTRILP
jgi:hypothetical protein